MHAYKDNVTLYEGNYASEASPSLQKINLKS